MTLYSLNDEISRRGLTADKIKNIQEEKKKEKEREFKESKAPNKKDWVGKNVSCTKCSKKLDASQMTTFQKYVATGVSFGLVDVISEHVYWEEVIPGRERTSPYSDKLPEKRVLCPTCAAQFIIIYKPRSGRSPSESEVKDFWVLAVIIFIFFCLGPLLFFIYIIKLALS